MKDYLAIHSWFDESKAFWADFRHRALRHHAEGIFLCERLFGPTLTNADGRVIPVRWVGEQHVREDLGRIPTAADWLKAIRPNTGLGVRLKSYLRAYDDNYHEQKRALCKLIEADPMRSRRNNRRHGGTFKGYLWPEGEAKGSWNTSGRRNGHGATHPAQLSLAAIFPSKDGFPRRPAEGSNSPGASVSHREIVSGCRDGTNSHRETAYLQPNRTRSGNRRTSGRVFLVQ